MSEEFEKHWPSLGIQDTLLAHTLRQIAEEVWAAAEKAEREACARVCDAIHAKHTAEFGEYLDDSYASISAAAIRARGNT